jgi:protocatechuate 3,4-dioxygenase beta subunit
MPIRRSSFRRVMLALGMVLSSSLAGLGAQSSTALPSQSSDATFRIAGTIVNAIGGNPLARARVAIVDAKNRQHAQWMITSDDGRFDFKQVSPGKYSLQGAKLGFIPAFYDEHEGFSTAIVTGAGLDTEHLVLRLDPSAMLSGKILDELGEPVRQATVSLYREDRRVGVGRITKSRNTMTDDQGAYEFSQLDAGSYFISATAKPWYALHTVSSGQPSAENLPAALAQSLDAQPLDVAYAITYYGDATEPDDATPIPVRGGDHLQADIHLNPVPALHLIFHVPENGANGFTMPMLQKPSFDGMEMIHSDGMSQVSPGVFEMTGVAPGRYSVRTPEAGSESNDVDVTTNGQELDMSTAQRASTVKATIQVLREPTLPPQIEVALRNSKMRIVAWQEMDAKGEVAFQDLAPGKYDVLAGSRPKAYSVVQMSSDSGIIAGHTLNVTAGASMTITLSLVGGTVNVEGFARRAGKAISGTMVVLVPKNPESNRELFRRDQSDQDGSFLLRSVIPGSYTIVAIENGWDLDWSRPGVIEHYAHQGQTITVSDRTQTTMHLTEQVEVQSR